jgi:hypothetical protein
MELTIRDLGAVGEFLGAIIVIVSIAYLAIQTKQSNRHAEAATELEFINGLNEIWNRWSSERTTDVLQRGFTHFSDLSNKDKALFQMQVGSPVNLCVTAKHLYEGGLLPAETAKAAEDVLVMVLSTPGGLE